MIERMFQVYAITYDYIWSFMLIIYERSSIIDFSYWWNTFYNSRNGLWNPLSTVLALFLKKRKKKTKKSDERIRQRKNIVLYRIWKSNTGSFIFVVVVRSNWRTLRFTLKCLSWISKRSCWNDVKVWFYSLECFFPLSTSTPTPKSTWTCRLSLVVSTSTCL